ncbi:MAG: hypothetical protein GX640_01395 [Fibrobacter sp.]|nr:hypothetical protein [Fibrobacter sp.]
MNKVILLKIINPILFFLVLFQFGFQFLSRAVHLSWQYQFHEYNGYAIGILAIVHLYLNGAWIKALFKKKRK